MAVNHQAAPLLRIEHLSKAFDGIQALNDVSFSVGAGELVALIGPNGAGKTTCFNVVNGQLEPDAGSVWLAGERIDGLPPQRVAMAGVGRTFQTAATFASMTARENVQLALLAGSGEYVVLAHRLATARRSEADALLARVGAGSFAEQVCASLSYADVKRVEFAIALAQREGAPRLLLMDEPTAGTAPRDRGPVMELVEALVRDTGVATLFTEHDVDVVFRFAARVIVLDRGRIIADGPPASVRADPRVQAVYLGTEA
ncbi:MAG: ABC transporter ATP-binding protein [Betaproteobacteria bacterium]|nr:MAG: ABC transporter ATP-binding protein [Betaproteobacteria bacterium]